MDDRRPAEQLSLFDLPPRPAARPRPPQKAAPPAARPAQLALPLREGHALRLIRGEGEGTGYRRGRLVGLPHPGLDRPLPSRAEITQILIQAGADLMAGRLSPTGASFIREAAEEALLCLEASARDPGRQAGFVRAARALEELCS